MSENKEDPPQFSGRLLCCPKTLILVFVPILLSFILLVSTILYDDGTDDAVLLRFQLGWVYMFLLMGIFWMTNVIRMSLTGFLPLIGLPLLGVAKSGPLSEAFTSNSNVSTIGTVILTIAMDACGLRKRITLRILKHSSGSLRWIYIYNFIVTVWLAMWIGSAAATFLMMQVVDDLLQNLKGEVSSWEFEEAIVAPKENDQTDANMNQVNNDEKPIVDEMEGEPKPFENKIAPEKSKLSQKTVETTEAIVEIPERKEDEINEVDKENEQLLQDLGGELFYAVAVAANIGGTLWPFSSTIGYEMMKLQYSLNQGGWSEASFMLYSWPLIVINSIVVLSLLLWFTFSGSSVAKCIVGFKEKRLCNFKQNESILDKMRQTFTEKHQELKQWSFHEKAVMGITTLYIIFSLTRLPLFMTGWSELIPYGIIKAKDTAYGRRFDRTNAGTSVTSMAAVILLFVIPKSGLNFCKSPKSSADKPKREGLLGWKTLQTKFPWAIFVLIGSSRCMGLFSNETICAPIAKKIEAVIQKSTTNLLLLKLIMIGMIFVSAHFISNTGATLVGLQFWRKLLVMTDKMNLGGSAFIPAFSVASLCFITPTSSVPTALVYRYKENKTLSAWYFLRLGTPLVLCTLVISVSYCLVWTRNGLANTQSAHMQ